MELDLTMTTHLPLLDKIIAWRGGGGLGLVLFQRAKHPLLHQFLHSQGGGDVPPVFGVAIITLSFTRF
jgi:hypothetical protein